MTKIHPEDLESFLEGQLTQRKSGYREDVNDIREMSPNLNEPQVEAIAGMTRTNYTALGQEAHLMQA
jgi:hypothetical protein